MKRFLAVATAVAILAGAAHADVTVAIPKAPVSQAEAEAYVGRLDEAVKKVCFQAFSPIVGLAFYGYQACLKAKAAEVERKDPTGLYALRDSPAATILAAR